MMLSRHRMGTGLAVLLIMVAAASCFNPFAPRIAIDRGISEPPPVPDTPRNLMRLFVWCWENRAIAEYRELFTEDYRFAFSAADSAGNAFQDRALNRDEDLESATNLFVGGGASEPPASRITLSLDPNIIALPDSRPGKTDPWHKEISTTVDLTIAAGAVEFRVVGRGRFFAVRGDSALIPEELKNRGFGPDPNRWYIERWEDETASNLTITPVEAAGLPRNTGSRGAPKGLEPRAGRGGNQTQGEWVGRAPPIRTVAGAANTIELQVTWGQVKARYGTERRAANP